MKEFMGISLGVHVFFMGLGKMVGCFFCSCVPWTPGRRGLLCEGREAALEKVTNFPLNH